MSSTTGQNPNYKMVRTTDLIPYARNSRTHSEEAQRQGSTDPHAPFPQAING